MGSTDRPVKRIVGALGLLIAAAVVVAIVLGAGPSSPKRALGGSRSSSTTTIERRDLVETDTEPGTLGHVNPRTVYNRLSGTITWLPSVGQVIKPGQALFRVAGEPVILMNGGTPAYRDLGPSDGDAQDVLELNRNLVALGFDPADIVVDAAWQTATSAGVDELQASLGEPETGTLKLGQLVFLPGDRVVSSVGAQLGSQAALRTAPPASEFVGLTKPGPTEQANTLAALLGLLKAESAQLKAAQAQLRAAGSNAPNSGGGSQAGSNGGSATPILTTSSTQLVVTVKLDPSRQGEAKVGEHVAVELPSGKRVNGRVSAVSPIAQSRTVPVTIAVAGHPSRQGLDQASVSVSFAEARATHVLSVPVTALLATQGGRYALQETVSPHRLIRITPGLFAAGYVEISGTGLYPGLVVADSQG